MVILSIIVGVFMILVAFGYSICSIISIVQIFKKNKDRLKSFIIDVNINAGRCLYCGTKLKLDNDCRCVNCGANYKNGDEDEDEDEDLKINYRGGSCL